MEDTKKRKGYKNIQDQIEANKRYLDNNPEANIKKKKSRTKSETKKFIRDYATKQELEEPQILIKEKLKKL